MLSDASSIVWESSSTILLSPVNALGYVYTAIKKVARPTIKVARLARPTVWLRFFSFFLDSAINRS